MNTGVTFFEDGLFDGRQILVFLLSTTIHLKLIPFSKCCVSLGAWGNGRRTTGFHPTSPPRLSDTRKMHLPRAGPTDFHVVPEIAAAIQSFVYSREAAPNKYIYFDIGGGTMDGVAFRFLNIRGRQKNKFFCLAA